MEIRAFDKVVVFNTAWMLRYRGLSGDLPKGGGEYIEEHGRGGEINNFKPVGGKCYGYVRRTHGGKVKLTRIAKNASGESLNGVTVVWTAPRAGFGSVVVGWYKNALVYSMPHSSPHSHVAVCKAGDAVLLSPERRVLLAPRGLKAMGQSNVWYPDSAKGHHFIEKVRQLINGKVTLTRKDRHGGSRKWQQDVEKRLRVERVAVHLAAKHFECLGYGIVDVQKDNKGWDLEAVKHGWRYRIEVKGISNSFTCVEFTPNEYNAMMKYKDSYCVCIASNIEGSKPRLAVYEYDPAEGWITSSGDCLRVAEVKTISAICSPM